MREIEAERGDKHRGREREGEGCRDRDRRGILSQLNFLGNAKANRENRRR